MALRVQLLGPVRAWSDGTELDLGGPQQRALLGLLALAPGNPISRAEIIDVLWPDQPPRTALNVIQTRVKRLRRILDPGRTPHGRSAVLPSVGDGYALNLDREVIDVERFRRLVAAARDDAGGDQRRAVSLLTEALTLWSGEPFADVPALANHPKAMALRAERRAALTRYGAAMIATGAATDALPALEEAAARQPLDEATQAGLIRAYQAAGQPARALALYDRTRRVLVDELGVGPGPELTEAYLAVLRAAPVDSAAPSPTLDAVAPTVPHQLPADVFGFTGRAAELSMLDSLTATPDSSGDGGPAGPTATVVAVLTGTAGVGKTALAVHWGHRARNRFPDGQLYLDLRGHHHDDPVSTGDALARLLTALGLPGQAIPLDLDDRAARYRTEIAGRRMLVVLDNAATAQQVRPLLPGTPTCVVLVTSRDRLAALVALHGARRIGVDLLATTEAVTLLTALVGPRAAAEPRAVADLARRCAHLPLALRIAAELAVGRPDSRLADLVGDLARHRSGLGRLDLGDDPRGAVRTVFSWSYQRLPDAAARAFRRLGLHPGPDLDRYAIAALCDVDLDAAADLADQLARAHLVRRTAAHRFALHDLLAEYAAELTAVEDDEPTRAAALARLLDYYVAASATAVDVLYPTAVRHRPGVPRPVGAPLGTRTPVPPLTDVASARAWLDAEREGLVALCTVASPHHAIHLAMTLYSYLEHGHYVDALTVQTHALRAASGTGDLIGQAAAATSLGAIHRLLGDYPAAAEHLTNAIAAYRLVGDGGPARGGEARALSNLGIVDERTGRYESAAAHHDAALLLYRAAGDRYGEASALNNLAAVHSPRRPDRAADHYRQALALYRDLGERVGEAIALSNLGSATTKVGQPELALDYQRQGLDLFRELGHRYGEAAVLNSIGDVLTALGRFDLAVEHQRLALTLFQELGLRYGEATAQNGLGEALTAMGRYAVAVEHHGAAAGLAVTTGDRDEQARAHHGAGRAHRLLGDLDRARDELARALDIYVGLGLPQADEVRADLDALGP